jgi:hypothetical protein
MNQSMIESLDNVLSYAALTVAMVLLAHKVMTDLSKTVKHLNSFLLHCMYVSSLYTSEVSI